MNGIRNGVGTREPTNDEEVKVDISEKQATTHDVDDEVIISEQKVIAPDGGWGWWIVFACLLLRTIIGGIGRSSGLFYLKFLEKFEGSATRTALVTSLSATVRLLLGPFVSVLCNRFSTRKLTYVGAAIFVVAVHISGYATSLGYLYFSYGVLGGIGRSLILTPCTILLGEYFDKRRSLAFGLASAGFGIGGFTVTPVIEILFQTYGFTGTFILLSGFACNLFVSVSLFRPVQQVQHTSVLQLPNGEIEPGEDVKMLSHISSTGSVHLTKVKTSLPKYEESVQESLQEAVSTDSSPMTATTHEHSNGGETNVNNSAARRQSKLRKTYEKARKTITGDKSDGKKKKLISFSILKDIRFLTLCISTFVFTLPTTGMFLPALARSRGITDLQAAYLLSIIAGCDTISRVIAGFVLDLKRLRNVRPYIYNGVSFIQSLVMFTIPSMWTFGQFSAICAMHGAVMGMKAAQRSVILVDILGVDKLASSFAILLGIQGVGTLIGPPVAGLLKDTYGKYDYTFYFGGTAIFVGAMILAAGNIRNYFVKKRQKPEDD